MVQNPDAHVTFGGQKVAPQAKLHPFYRAFKPTLWGSCVPRNGSVSQFSITQSDIICAGIEKHKFEKVHILFIYFFHVYSTTENLF